MTRRKQLVVESNQQIADKLIAAVRSGNVEPDSTAEGAAVMNAAGLFAIAAAVDRLFDLAKSLDERDVANERERPAEAGGPA